MVLVFTKDESVYPITWSKWRKREKKMGKERKRKTPVKPIFVCWLSVKRTEIALVLLDYRLG